MPLICKTTKQNKTKHCVWIQQFLDICAGYDAQPSQTAQIRTLSGWDEYEMMDMRKYPITNLFKKVVKGIKEGACVCMVEHLHKLVENLK